MSTSSESSQLSELFSLSQSSTTTIRTFSGLQPSHSTGFAVVTGGRVGIVGMVGGTGNGHGNDCGLFGLMWMWGAKSGACEWITGASGHGMLGIGMFGIWMLGIWGKLGSWGNAGSWIVARRVRTSVVISSANSNQKSTVVRLCPITGLNDIMLRPRTARTIIDLKLAIADECLRCSKLELISIGKFLRFIWKIARLASWDSPHFAQFYFHFHHILHHQARQLWNNWKIFATSGCIIGMRMQMHIVIKKHMQQKMFCWHSSVECLHAAEVETMTFQGHLCNYSRCLGWLWLLIIKQN